MSCPLPRKLRWVIDADTMKRSSEEKPADSDSSPVDFSCTLVSRTMRSGAEPGFCSMSSFSWKKPSELMRSFDRLTRKLLKASRYARRNSRRTPLRSEEHTYELQSLM